MLSEESRAEYEARMHRVHAYVDAHLDQTLDLVTLAGVAHFSPFHFHRLFAAWMGETLGDYVRRRRVEVAAMRMIAQPRISVLRMALSVGFGSAEAFSRAFRARFGSSPTVWRARQRIARATEKSNPRQIMSNERQAGGAGDGEVETIRSHHLEVPMHVMLIDRPPVTIAYLRHVGPYGDSVLAFWQHQFYPWVATNGLLHSARYGISHDDPHITAPEQCRYDAGVEVAPDQVVTAPALLATIPGGRYAVAPYKGTADDIAGAWRQVIGTWLPSSGLQMDARPCFEHYPPGASFDPATGVFDCEICIPVAPL
jgi:AraC family transcriptional regulator